VLLNIGSEVAYSDKGMVTAVAWVIGGQPTYAFEGIINFTGATITWLRDQLGLIESVKETEELATAVSDNGGVYFVPAFVGLSAPYWQPNARAAVVGLTPACSKNHVVRAALEGIAFRIRDVLSLMAAEAGVDLQIIHADGGAVSNQFLMQFVADLTQLTVRASRIHELSALGAALAGLMGMEVLENFPAVAHLARETVDFSPVMSADDAAEIYEGWQHAVQQVLYRPK